ncbi:Beta-1,4-galactosyltransferase 1 [Schistosoma japonicum]|uniref:Beta-1,4-galactosyltransferase n=1 Tax=Schistosoma japonicum TaxID=6182 RepID=A0A4Z2CVK0_SCHJA|nr:Beta-1,4-galactosyltransferase 1 [Schistosoma japonicum]
MYLIFITVLHQHSLDITLIKSDILTRKIKRDERKNINVSNHEKLDCLLELQNELRNLYLIDTVNLVKQTSGILKNFSHFNTQQTCQDICNKLPVIPSNMTHTYKPIGNISLTKVLETNLYNVINLNKPHIPGGGWTYKTSNKCINNPDEHKQSGVAIVIAFRDRWIQLTSVLSTLIPMLRRQRLCYRIFVIEEAGNGLFNRGMIFNVGFMEAMKRFHFDCVIFHDADLAPINDLNPYGCDKQTFMQPIHLGVGLDTRKFRLNYPKLIGGVLKMSKQHFMQVNGHSNLYWGWGQEDDDLERRLKYAKINYYQMSPSIARYKALPHESQKKDGNPRKIHLKLLATAVQRMYYDGLSTLNYKVINVIEHQLFTHILVDLGIQPKFYNCNN